MTGSITGGVRALVRLEGAGALVAAVLLYRYLGLGWGAFALFFLAPDLSFAAYLAGPRVGAAAYNAVHAYLGPLACLTAGALAGVPVLVQAGLIWSAHIGMDRALGYGLKYAEGFGSTHLGRIGRAREA